MVFKFVLIKSWLFSEKLKWNKMPSILQMFRQTHAWKMQPQHLLLEPVCPCGITHITPLADGPNNQSAVLCILGVASVPSVCHIEHVVSILLCGSHSDVWLLCVEALRASRRAPCERNQDCMCEEVMSRDWRSIGPPLLLLAYINKSYCKFY